LAITFFFSLSPFLLRYLSPSISLCIFHKPHFASEFIKKERLTDLGSYYGLWSYRELVEETRMLCRSSDSRQWLYSQFPPK
jgi:hypothetical protein